MNIKVLKNLALLLSSTFTHAAVDGLSSASGGASSFAGGGGGGVEGEVALPPIVAAVCASLSAEEQAEIHALYHQARPKFLHCLSESELENAMKELVACDPGKRAHIYQTFCDIHNRVADSYIIKGNGPAAFTFLFSNVPLDEFDVFRKTLFKMMDRGVLDENPFASILQVGEVGDLILRPKAVLAFKSIKNLETLSPQGLWLKFVSHFGLEAFLDPKVDEYFKVPRT